VFYQKASCLYSLITRMTNYLKVQDSWSLKTPLKQAG
jgi:hypothetical protein